MANRGCIGGGGAALCRFVGGAAVVVVLRHGVALHGLGWRLAVLAARGGASGTVLVWTAVALHWSLMWACRRWGCCGGLPFMHWPVLACFGGWLERRRRRDGSSLTGGFALLRLFLGCWRLAVVAATAALLWQDATTPKNK
jgi:hypothetical protein